MPKRENYDLPLLTKQDQPQPITKSSAAKGILGGYASKWWEVDSYGECTAPGCFTKSITERGPAGSDRILFRYEHMVTVGKHTEMVEDETGLRIEAFVSDDGQDGTRLRTHLKDDIQYGISIGFRRLRARPGTTDDPFDLSQAPAWLTTEFDPANVIVLEECRLMEDSAVSFPAVDSALIDSYRHAGADDIDRLISDLKAGTLRPQDKTRIEQLAALLPAAIAPAPQHKASPDTADSDIAIHLLDIAASIATANQWSTRL